MTETEKIIMLPARNCNAVRRSQRAALLRAAATLASLTVLATAAPLDNRWAEVRKTDGRRDCSSRSAATRPICTADTAMARHVGIKGDDSVDDLMRSPHTFLFGLGDSMTHGTMDATNNDINTLHAYLQLIADSLEHTEMALAFSQPLFDQDQERKRPFAIPTNLAVDGADSFTVDGIEYYKRVGADESFINDAYLCDNRLPGRFDSKYDKVLYPINLKAHRPVSQIDALIWHLNRLAEASVEQRALIVFWVGNNDSSAAALGGGENPMSLPVPGDLIEPDVTRALRLLLRFGQNQGLVSFEPYALPTIERNLTTTEDFALQYEELLSRIETESALPPGRTSLFLLTLPYYSAVGFLFDSEDIEFYLRRLDPDYTVPPTFARVAPPGEPITDPLRGDRVSLLTFGMMYTLMFTGRSADYVNEALEVNGVQRDGLVLSEDEQRYVMSRIDSYNGTIEAAAAARPANVHLVRVGQFLNEALAGDVTITVGGRVLSRKWVRGSGFTLDGVHPGYTGQALVANFVLERMNEVLGFNAPLSDLEEVFATDPYVDHDGDGWAPGPDYKASGAAELLFLLRDLDDDDPSVGAELPDNVWRLISNALLTDLLGIPAIRLEAERLGIRPDGI